MKDNKERLDWFSLERYTKDFKEWILKLFRKSHARMGHIEEELSKVREEARADYQLETNEVTVDSSTVIRCTLVETISGEEHGHIEINPDQAIFIPNWEEDGGKWEDQ
jgi:hypothetical protein